MEYYEVTIKYPFDELLQCELCKDGPSSQPSGARRRIFGLYQYQNHSDLKKHLKKTHCRNVLLKFRCRICNRTENDLKKQKRHYNTTHNTEARSDEEPTRTPSNTDELNENNDNIDLRPSNNVTNELPEIVPEEQRNSQIYETGDEATGISTDVIVNQEQNDSQQNIETLTANEISNNGNIDNQLIPADREGQILGAEYEPEQTNNNIPLESQDPSSSRHHREDDSSRQINLPEIPAALAHIEILPSPNINNNTNNISINNSFDEDQSTTQTNDGIARANGSKPTKNQEKWLKQLEKAASWSEFEKAVSNITKEIADATAQRMPPEKTQRRHNYNSTAQQTRRNRNPQTDRFDPAEAGKIQKLYRVNKKKAISKILNGTSGTYCQVGKEEVTQFYKGVFSDKEDAQRATPDYINECINNMRAPGTNQLPSLEDPIKAEDISFKLNRTKNTAPGKDGIKYSQLKRADPGCLVLASIFNRCFKEEKTPLDWTTSRTVLIHKKGDHSDLNNWRPLSLGNTMVKLYASIISGKVATWNNAHKIISPVQKGFMEAEGCYENNFLVQSVIDDARRNGKEAVLAWLDLTNAFGSIPHRHIYEMLNLLGLPNKLQNIIHNMYSGARTTITTSQGDTNEIKIRSGVKQGCPLSPIIFNISIEPLLRVIKTLEQNNGYRLHNNTHSILAYADDIVLIAKNEEAMQNMLSKVGETAEWMGLKFNAKKCATLHIDCRKRRETRETLFHIQGEHPVVLKDSEQYEYLGIPTGYRVNQTPEEAINSMIVDVKKLHESLLTPWQKIEALNMFVLSKLDFILRGAKVAMKPLHKADNKIKAYVKKWLNLPQRASPELLYMPAYQGGANLTPLADNAKILKIAHAFKLLTCSDNTIKSAAWDCLKSSVRRKTGGEPTKEDIANYLSGSIEDNFSRDGGDISTIWSQARNACRLLNQTKMGVRFQWSEIKNELILYVDTPSNPIEKVIVPESARSYVLQTLRAGIRNYYKLRLLAKPDQGKVYRNTVHSAASNHFILTGKYTRFCDYRFVSRARLGTVPLNGTRRFGNGDKRCRKCGYQSETLPHVINHCTMHSTAWKRRHDAIVERVCNAVRLKNGDKLSKNRKIEGSDLNLRPDIVLRNDGEKTIQIIDVAVPFEGSNDALEVARQQKINKYSCLRNELLHKGYSVFVEGFVVGALGAWHNSNTRTTDSLGISRRYAKTMARLMVSDTIRWSRDIYIEHVTGRRQFV